MLSGPTATPVGTDAMSSSPALHNVEPDAAVRAMRLQRLRAASVVTDPDVPFTNAVPLKNFLPTTLAHTAPEGVVDVVTQGNALSHAVRLALPDGAGSKDPSAADTFARYTQDRGGRVCGAAVVRPSTGSRRPILWSAAVVVLPGATATMLLPATLPVTRHPEEDAAAAVEAAVEMASAAGVRLAQVLLPQEATAVRNVLTTRNQFEPAAELAYLHKRVTGNTAAVELPDGLELATYSSELRPLFAEAIEASYADSLDCTALNGLRSMDEVLDGHQASGVFRPDWWHVVLSTKGGQRKPVGVLLLAGLGNDGNDGVELVYLGLAPEVRGTGLSEVLMNQADATAATTRHRWLALAVDTRNAPGLKLYSRRGSHQIAKRDALFHVFGASPTS